MRYIILLAPFIIAIASGCKKMISVTPSTGFETAQQVFSSYQEAQSAVAGIYYNLINSSGGSIFSNSGTTIYTGLSADELLTFNATGTSDYQFQQNKVLTSNTIIGNCFWDHPFQAIYQANAVITGLNASSINDSIRTELIGECEFIRAFCNFYLVNLFGAIPDVTSINWKKTSILSRTSVADMYNAMIADLKDAKIKLSTDFSAGNGERIVPNKWTASALLSRIYLYTNQWQLAADESSLLINNTSLFQLETLNNVFSTTSQEAIWQLKHDNGVGPNFNGVQEGLLIIPTPDANTSKPQYFLTPTLLSSFEPSDQRRSAWVDSTNYMGLLYYYPYKYQQNRFSIKINGSYNQYYTIFRLSEQFLIRAEAEANGATSPSGDDIADLNTIRQRAGLANYSGPGDPASIQAAIRHEWQVEFFAEWGHRWLDLKRWGLTQTLLSSEKGYSITPDNLLYPLPLIEVQTDPNLSQNPGY